MFTWTSAAKTDIGKRRRVNEDAYLARPEIGLWAVADGMGGYHAGDVASNAIIEAFKTIPAPHKMSAFVNDVEKQLLTVNTQLYEMAKKRRCTIGSTVVALLAFESHCVVLWAGDSRVYRYRAGQQLELLTQDHSLVEEWVEKGELSREEAKNHPDVNVITRAVGAEEELFLDFDIYPIQNKDIFLLCSDGLYRDMNESEIAKVLSKRRRKSQQAADDFIELTLKRNAKDNITAVIIQAQQNRR